MNYIIGIYDKFCTLTEGDEGFAWDEVWVLCGDCLSKVTSSEYKVLGETAEHCLDCRP